ncbi:hypothetical protein ACLMJK_002937 [Lecanora helva]
MADPDQVERGKVEMRTLETKREGVENKTLNSLKISDGTHRDAIQSNDGAEEAVEVESNRGSTGGLGILEAMHKYLNLSDGPTILNFRKDTMINILHLQNEIMKRRSELRTDEGDEADVSVDMKQFEDLLNRYTTAIRNYDYMDALETAPRADLLVPLNILDMYRRFSARDMGFKRLPRRSSQNDPLRRALSRFLPQTLTWTVEEIDSRFDDWRLGKRSTITSPFVDRLARFIVALTGGLSLVVPMLIMRIHQNTTKSLVTTSVAVILFSGIVSVGFNASNAETLGITAAYAAVLVVFVGTSA